MTEDNLTTCPIGPKGTVEHMYVMGSFTCLCGEKRADGLEVSKILELRLPDDFDPYGKDVSPVGSNREPTYIIKGGTFVRLTDEELADRDAERRMRRHS